jgi:hypothetical protein
MNRKIFVFVIAALFIQAAATFAQDSHEPSMQAVLEAARAKYWSRIQKMQDALRSDRGEDQPEVGYTPVLLSFVPGISLPFGYWDASFAAGTIGTISRDIYGFEGSGVFNITRNVFGFQGAGVFNIVSGRMSGFQGAGVFNIVDGKSSGFQGAGVFNIAKDIDTPLQAAGVFNIAGRVAGVQAAGVFNIAERVDGAQLASIVNVADRVSGLQVGLVNIADRMDGVQLGLVNIARNGVNSLGALYEPDTGFAYGYWQAGTPFLYTLVGAGMPKANWFKSYDDLLLSFGLGSRLSLGHSYIDLDVSAERYIGSDPVAYAKNYFTPCKNFAAELATLYPSVRLSFGLPIAGRVHLYGGLKVDVELDGFAAVPTAIKGEKTYARTWFGIPFTAYPKWFFGLKI